MGILNWGVRPWCDGEPGRIICIISSAQTVSRELNMTDFQWIDLSIIEAGAVVLAETQTMH